MNSPNHVSLGVAMEYWQSIEHISVNWVSHGPCDAIDSITGQNVHIEDLKSRQFKVFTHTEPLPDGTTMAVTNFDTAQELCDAWIAAVSK
jgi:hypothetical protein